MGGEDDGLAALGALFHQQTVEEVAVLRVEAEHRLVKDDIGAVYRQRQREPEDARVAGGKRLDLLLGGQREFLRHAHGVVHVEGGVEAARELERPVHLHAVREEVGLRHHVHLAQSAVVARRALAVYRYLALVGPDAVGNEVHHRGLACAVGAEQAVDYAAAEFDGHIVQRRGGAVALGHASQFYSHGSYSFSSSL